jgi:hypothetical protein
MRRRLKPSLRAEAHATLLQSDLIYGIQMRVAICCFAAFGSNE